MLFEVNNLKSVIVDFPENQEILERVFGQDGSPIAPDWFEVTGQKLSSLIDELSGSDDKDMLFIRQQALIIRALLTFAKSSGGELHLLYQADKTLEFFFSFEEARPAFLFECYVRDFVQDATGLQL